MATINLLPNGTLSNNWGIVGGGGATADGVLADTDDATLIETSAISRHCTLHLDDFDASGLGSTGITSIRHYISGYKFNTRGGDTDVNVELQNAAATLYTETHSLTFNSYNAQAFFGTARTTYNGSMEWNGTDAGSLLNGLRLEVNTDPEDPSGVSKARVVQAYVEVTYTTGSVATENAIFFGCAF